MKEFWNERFSQPGLAYGEAPNTFVKLVIDLLPPGRVLFPAEGQGRNAIYAAQSGWKVDAFDYAEEGRNSALIIAEKLGVHLHYEICSFEEFTAHPGKYDLVFLCYVHMKNEWRKPFYSKLVQSLKRDGYLAMEAFTKTQLAYESGGPKAEDLLYNKEIVLADFRELATCYVEEMVTELNEGKYHVGPASIIRYLGMRN